MEIISGGVCAAKGFKANGIHCGIRKNKSKRDLALIVSETAANAAAVYTTNLVKGAPLLVTKKHLENGKAQAIICNSGNANTCNANGIEIAEQTCDILADELGISSSDIVVASTGVIGQVMDIAPFTENVKDGIYEVVEQKKEMLNSGQFDVFYGPVYDTEGEIRIGEGENMSDEAMLNFFDWYVKGVQIYEK